MVALTVLRGVQYARPMNDISIRTPSPGRVVAAVNALRAKAEADPRFEVEPHPVSDESFRVLALGATGGRRELFRVVVIADWPIEIFDGARRNTKIGVAAAERKLDGSL